MKYTMTPYELNQTGFEQRLKNYELNSIDWQLYHSDGYKELTMHAIIELNDALKEAVKVYPDWRDAQAFMRKVMEKHINVGACDTEPDSALCDFLEYFYKCETSRW